MVDASHSIIDIIRPRYPRGALLEGGVEPLDNLGEVLVARVRRGVEGYACEASAADAPKLGEEVFAENGLDDRLEEMGGCASVGGRSKGSRAACKASKESAAMPHVQHSVHSTLLYIYSFEFIYVSRSVRTNML